MASEKNAAYRLTGAQERALRAAADGRLVRTHGGQFASMYILDKAGTLTGADPVRVVTVDKLTSSGMIVVGGPAPGLQIVRGTRYEPGTAGREWLAAHPAGDSTTHWTPVTLCPCHAGPEGECPDGSS
jgi:hypothetical protein